MKKLFLILLFTFAFCLLPFHLKAQWTQLPNLPVSGTVYDMYFVNANTGWTTFNTTGTILKTTNGGQNWIQQTTPASEVYDIQFFNDTLGVALSYLSTNRLILKTTNGGANWNQIYSTGFAWFNMQFISKDTGWVCGFDGTFGGVWRTTDGGNNWVRQYTSVSNGLDKIFFLKNKINGEYWGWTFKATILFRTTNSGVNWTTISGNLGGGCGDGFDMYFKDTTNGIITRSSGCFSKTTNGGFNWTHFQEFNSLNSHITMGNDMTGWISLTPDTVIKTTNFFQAYGKQITPAWGYVLFALDTSLIYGARNMTNVVKTTNGGGNIVGINLISSTVPEKFMLYQNYPNPFNPATNIKYQIVKSKYVILKVYDILGKEVITLVSRNQNAGTYEVTWDASNYPSGVYFYKLNTEDYTETKKMSLIK